MNTNPNSTDSNHLSRLKFLETLIAGGIATKLGSDLSEVCVDDIEREYDRLKNENVVFEVMSSGTIYEDTDDIRQFYTFLSSKAKNWDGRNPIRDMSD